jgi:hypothetical protein
MELCVFGVPAIWIVLVVGLAVVCALAKNEANPRMKMQERTRQIVTQRLLMSCGALTCSAGEMNMEFKIVCLPVFRVFERRRQHPLFCLPNSDYFPERWKRGE